MSNNGPATNVGLTEERKDGVVVPAEAVPTSENVDYKADNRYANAITKKQEAVSEFTRSKTLKE